MKKTITLNINKFEEMHTYDIILDQVTIYEENWEENGKVILTVNAEEYEEAFEEEE